MEANFETLKNLERTIQKEADRPLASLHEKTVELKRQIDQLDRRLRDRSDIVEVRIRMFLYSSLLDNKRNRGGKANVIEG